jgi:hypothetical protein
MIKFFRRFRQKLLTENKFSKYLIYAIGEIILVVIGILIALQINNWNENRKAKRVEKITLTQLLEDFNTNKMAIKGYLEEYTRTQKIIDIILRNTGPDAQIPSPETFDTITGFGLRKAQLLYTKPNTTASLNLDHISNNQLKQLISTFSLVYENFESTEAIIEKLTLEQRKIHQKYIPLIGSEPKYKQKMFFPDTMGLLRDPQLQNVTVDKYWNINAAKYSLSYIEKHNDSIITLINMELAKLPE